jgi:acid phosphatase (class A)
MWGARFFVVGLALLAGCASVPAQVAEPPLNAGGFAVGYLARVPDARAFLAPPPGGDSALQAGELATVIALRAPRDEARWAQAIADNRVDAGQAFAVPLGMVISTETTPNLTRVLARVTSDVVAVYDPAKEAFGRMRPFQTDTSIETCIAGDAAQMARLANSRSYPSGHAAFGWAWALLLSEMVPERADAILARGREYGWSRVVCGVHYPSDVQAGQLSAAAIVAALDADPAFERDFAIARTELRAAMGLR